MGLPVWIHAFVIKYDHTLSDRENGNVGQAFWQETAHSVPDDR
jgi:hypothetical protein